MKKLLTVIFILLISASAQAQKEAPLPKDLPPYGPQPALHTPEVKTTKLENGLTVWLVAQRGLPKVSLRAVVLGGLAVDPSDRSGLADLLARTLNQGTTTLSAKQIAEQMQLAGGDLGVGSDRDSISISASVLSSKADLAVSILADVMENASFPDNEVNIAKRNMASSLQQEDADPGFQAQKAVANALFGSGPYSVIGATQESLARMTAADLRQEFARRFRPDQALLVAVGDFDAAKMNDIIKEKFGSWKAPAGPPATVDAKPTGRAEHEIIIKPRANSVQTTLVLAAFGPLRNDPDYEAVQVANAIYGGTFGSRLVGNIREDKGYTYSPGSGVSALRQAGILTTHADVRNAVTGPSLNEIMYEMNRMATTSPTEEELNRAKRSLLGIQAILLQSRGAVAGELANLWLHGLGPDSVTVSNQKLNAVTAQDVDRVSRKYFPASRMTIVCVGEEKVVKDAVAPFGLPVKSAK